MRPKPIAVIPVIVILSILLSSCGSSNKKAVPDIILEAEAESCDFYEYGDSAFSWKAVHNYNDEAHIDDVVLNVVIDSTYGKLTTYLPLRYQFNKAADNWELIRRGEWSEEVVSIKNKILDSYSGTSSMGDGSYLITIKSIGDDQITVKYTIKGKTSVGLLTSPSEYTLQGEATGFCWSSGRGCQFSIDIELPDDMYSGSLFYPESTSELYGYIDIDEGLRNVWWMDIRQ